MGIHRQSQSKTRSRSAASTRLLHVNIPTASNFSYEKSDFIWNDPNELDLLNFKKPPMMATPIDENHFFNVLPSIRRLYTTLNCRCPNLYRIHCSNSYRILQEMLCIIEEYLHVSLSPSISVASLLENAEDMDDFIEKVKYSPYYPVYSNQRPTKNEINLFCYGQGIRPWESNNQLNETSLFCFELTAPHRNDILSPLEILILDPNYKMVSHDIRYINTYDQGYTKLFSCGYTPITQEGTYKISFFYNDLPLTRYPYSVFIQNSADKHEIAKHMDSQKREVSTAIDEQGMNEQHQ